ncbi:MAG: DUF6760 family protein [Dermatophilaceae bacterium]
MTYAADRIHEEVAYVAYHFHWDLDDILDMEHGQRRRYVREIAEINRRIAEER